jgi:hypothetical protein
MTHVSRSICPLEYVRRYCDKRSVVLDKHEDGTWYFSSKEGDTWDAVMHKLILEEATRKDKMPPITHIGMLLLVDRRWRYYGDHEPSIQMYTFLTSGTPEFDAWAGGHRAAHKTPKLKTE